MEIVMAVVVMLVGVRCDSGDDGAKRTDTSK